MSLAPPTLSIPYPPSSASSDEKKTEDIESSSLPCKICLEYDGKEDDELISPCMCKGTQQFVHRSCLDHWRSVKEGFAFSHCTTCKAQFHLRVAELEDSSWRKIKFRLFVARDMFLLSRRTNLALPTHNGLSEGCLLHGQTTPSKWTDHAIVIVLMGGFVYLSDKDGSVRKSFNDGWGSILSMHPIPFYYFTGCCTLVIVFVVSFTILGNAYGFRAATMAIQRIWQRHYHILTSTQEYIVEDLHGCYTPPKLDPEHEERLRILKLL